MTYDLGMVLTNEIRRYLLEQSQYVLARLATRFEVSHTIAHGELSRIDRAVSRSSLDSSSYSSARLFVHPSMFDQIDFIRHEISPFHV